MDRSIRDAKRVTLLGGDVDLVTADQVMGFVAEAVGSGRKAIVANHNLHSLHLIRRDPELVAFFDKADLVQLDSMPLVIWGRLRGLGTTRVHRNTYLDWREQFWRMASKRGWRVYYLGGARGVASEAASRLMKRWPGVQIATSHGYFESSPASADNAAVIEDINGFQPQVLLVGMGMPLQELWIGRNSQSLADCVMLPVGAAFDYEAGVQVAAPRVVGALGLEWLFRLILQPRRLFWRYLVEPWSLLLPVRR